jgi:hypothetical protein
MIGQGAALTRPERVRAALKATGGGVRPNTAVFPKAGIAPMQAFFRATGSGIGVRAADHDVVEGCAMRQTAIWVPTSTTRLAGI